ncbi:MAG: CPBP family intramembrane metalloprotease [Chloroflexi bacterium]|nr:CPBP family intramembrane glutamic endopeptidase [Anaerolineaceae bacterium]NMB90813.1 CPBP family intramembrane metalloprotease [Chloroflexota bacterium]
MTTANEELTHQDLLTRTRQDPANYFNWLMLGWTAKTPHAARNYFQEALRLKPGDPVVLDSIDWAEENLPDRRAIQATPGAVPVPVEASLAATRPVMVPAFARPVVRRLTQTDLVVSVLVYLGAIAAAEGLTTLVATAAAGLVFHALVMVALLLHSAITPQPRLQHLYLTLALAPLIRIVSLSLPLQNYAFVYWYIIVGIPLFLSVGMVARYAGFGLKETGVNARHLPVQLLFGIAGLGLGGIEYLVLRPAALVSSLSLESIWLPAMILVIFTGLLEEFIFRGVMQKAFTAVFGHNWGILYISALFAVLHVGYQSALDVVFVFAVALLFGWFAHKTGSILGVTLAHGLTNISLFLLFPFLIGG